MSKYKLIAFDMDGTLLNSEKEISERTRQAILRASRSGKLVALNTGRSISELTQYTQGFPALRYGILQSGSLIYDFKSRIPLQRTTFTRAEVRRLVEVSQEEDVMIQLMCSGDMLVSEGDLRNMDHFHMGSSYPSFKRAATTLSDVRDLMRLSSVKFEKINFFCATLDGRERCRKKLRPLGITFADAEYSALEMTPRGTNKGQGLTNLCHVLGIPLGEAIAVGDADNDRQVLSVAGLSVAMGNAREDIKEICDVVVADNDHNGCAEAIEKYLLGE